MVKIEISEETMKCFKEFLEGEIKDRKDYTIEEFVRRNLDALGYLN